MLNLVTCDGLMSVTPPLPPVSLAAPPEFDYFYLDLDTIHAISTNYKHEQGDH